MTPDILGQLQGIQVGEHTMADLYRFMVKAGKAIGRQAQERTRLQVSLTREGTALPEASSSQVRFEWIRAAHLFLGVLDALPLADELREKLLAPLENGVAEAIQRRMESPGDMPEDELDEDAPDAPDDDAGLRADVAESAELDAAERTMEMEAPQVLVPDAQAATAVPGSLMS